MNINVCRFFIDATDETFVKNLYCEWNGFFDDSFVAVFDEVLSAQDADDDIWQIDRLELDLGALPQEGFADSFASALRVKLRELLLCLIQNKSGVHQNGVSYEGSCRTLSVCALEMFVYFLRHGSLPEGVDSRFCDLHFLFRQTLRSESAGLHDFLESYGHYDFVVNRLALQLDDEELELLLSKVRPSESKFVCLYVRLHLANYREHLHSGRRRPFLDCGVYRDVLWQLVFSYLYAEEKGRFSRKQFLLYTLKGMSSHYNLSLTDFVGWVTFSLAELRALSLYRPEFMEILLEISNEVGESAPLLSLYEGHCRRWLLPFLSQDSGSECGCENCLSVSSLVLLFSDEAYLQAILPTLEDKEVAKVVSLLFPAEKDFILHYAAGLECCRNKGALTGKCGENFRDVKWKFIFLVSLEYPQTRFARQSFVCSVLVRLSNHYNVTLVDLILLFMPVAGSQLGLVSDSSLVDILAELFRMFVPSESVSTVSDRKENLLLSEMELVLLLHNPVSSEMYVNGMADSRLEDMVLAIRPSEGSFIVEYSHLLNRYKDGLFEGRAGDGFRALKWRFLLSCLLLPQGVIFYRKIYVLRVIQSLASHYNFSVVELLSCFVRLLPETKDSDVELVSLIRELYAEHLLPSSPLSSSVSRMSELEMERWLRILFGETPVNEEYRNRWLLFAIRQNPTLLARMWRSGELLPLPVFLSLRRDARLLLSFLRAIADSRIEKLYSQALLFFRELKSAGVSGSVLNELSEEALLLMVQFSDRGHLSWSLDEMKTTLMRQLSVVSVKRELLASLQKEMKIRTSAEVADGDSADVSPNVGRRVENLRQTLEKINEFKLKENKIKKRLKKKKSKENKMSEFLISKTLINETLTNANLISETLASEISERIQQRWSLSNVGNVLLSPYFPRLFQHAGYLNEKSDNFLDDDFRIRAVFLLQYVVYGEEREYEEPELFLNRLLVGLADDVPLPTKLELTEQERALVDDMLPAVKGQWSKMKNTAVSAFRAAFLQRAGVLEFDPDKNFWMLNVEERAYDILLDTVPWSFKMFKHPWMSCILNTVWR